MDIIQGVILDQTQEVYTGWGGGGYLLGVLPPRHSFSSLSGGGVPVNVTRTRKATGGYYVQALEGPSGDPEGGYVLFSTVTKLRHAYSKGRSDQKPMDVLVKLGNQDAISAARCGYGSEIWRDEF